MQRELLFDTIEAYVNELKELRIKKTGISKYCLGMALTGQAKKINILKRKLREIQKITNHEHVA